MGDFVGHDAGKLVFLTRGLEQPAVDVQEAARQREGVDLRPVDYFYRERDLQVGVTRHVLGYSIDVLVDHRVGDEFGGTVDLRRILPPGGDFPLLGDDALVRHLAIADLAHVALRVRGLEGQADESDRRENCQPLYNVLPAEQRCHTGVPPTSNRCLKGKPGYLGGLPDHRSLLDFAQSAADTTRQRFANETKQGWGGEQGPECGPVAD